MDDKIKLTKLEIKDGVYVDFGPGGGVPGGCQSISGGRGGISPNDLSMSGGEGEGQGQGSWINYTIDCRPELDAFKQEVLKRLKRIDISYSPKQYYIPIAVIQDLITWIERGTD